MYIPLTQLYPLPFFFVLAVSSFNLLPPPLPLQWYREFYQISPLEIETGHPDGTVTRTFLEEDDDGGKLKDDTANTKKKGRG